MKSLIPIHKLSMQIGLTSRTLRHWEAEGLFKSSRDAESGWRVYDEEAVLAVRITALLRNLDISIKEIKLVLESKSYDCLSLVVRNQISVLKAQNNINMIKEKRLIKFLSLFENRGNKVLSDSDIPMLLADIESAEYQNKESEELIMSTKNINETLQFVTIPPSRAVGYVAVGLSPEDEAIGPVVEWIEAEGLMGTARFYGGNMPPLPSGDGKPYGYGMCATIPGGITIPEHLHEIKVEGGIYARLESTDDISGSWGKLMALLEADEKYTSDRKRLCYEEHIPDDKGGFILVLLEPVKEK